MGFKDNKKGQATSAWPLCYHLDEISYCNPYDLRRTTATGTRAILGKEAAKVLLGHTKTDTTDICLLEEVQEAMKVAKLLASSVLD